jgi:hypothetical protein
MGGDPWQGAQSFAHPPWQEPGYAGDVSCGFIALLAFRR